MNRATGDFFKKRKKSAGERGKKGGGRRRSRAGSRKTGPWLLREKARVAHYHPALDGGGKGRFAYREGKLKKEKKVMSSLF